MTVIESPPKGKIIGVGRRAGKTVGSDSTSIRSLMNKSGFKNPLILDEAHLMAEFSKNDPEVTKKKEGDDDEGPTP